jgi:tetratricopeptide (TPR) repeat protein
VHVRSGDGRYEVAFHEGPDRLLAPYALDAVRRADESIAAVLGYRVPGPIRLEIYETPSELSRVSGLTVEAIERTGTIALCKWDRLMVTSPRALARGYSWVDTISHELVHLVVARISRDHAPVWLQEGLAKFLERTFRTGRPALGRDPSSEALLSRAAREGRLLPFDSFHPSIAMLPSQEDAALAFAQVSTLIAMFHGRNGDEGLRHLLREVAGGVDPRTAIASIESMPFDTFYELVFEDVKGRPAPSAAPEMLPLRFTRRGPVAEDDVRDVRIEDAARHVRLGDMLWSRGRAGAAAAEYERAAAVAPQDPIVGSRLARSALEAGQPDRAIAAARRIIERYPTHAPAWAVLAQAQRLKNENEAAVASAFEAIRQNPFDPAPHCVLAEAFTDPRGRASADAACRSLRSR